MLLRIVDCMFLIFSEGLKSKLDIFVKSVNDQKKLK